jgi:hypothetical protein
LEFEEFSEFDFPALETVKIKLKAKKRRMTPLDPRSFQSIEVLPAGRQFPNWRLVASKISANSAKQL